MLIALTDREELEASNDCLRALRDFDYIDNTTRHTIRAVFNAAREACDDDMDLILNIMEESMNASYPVGDDMIGFGILRHIISDAASASTIRSRPCPTLEMMGEDIFGTLAHISPSARLFRRILDSMDSEDDEEEDLIRCRRLTEVSDNDVAYLKLRDLIKRDGRLRMLMAAALDDGGHRNRPSSAGGIKTCNN